MADVNTFWSAPDPNTDPATGYTGFNIPSYVDLPPPQVPTDYSVLSSDVGPNQDTILSDPTQTGSFIQKLLRGNGSAQGLADAASILGGFSAGQKANRVVQGNMTQGYDRSMLEAQAARNQNESDAMKKLAQTNYILNGGSTFNPNIVTASGRHITLPTFGLAPKPVSDAQKQGASTLQSQLIQRLAPGGSYTPQPLSSYAVPGAAENVGNYGALAAGGLGALSTIMGGNPSQAGSNIDYAKLASSVAPSIISYLSGL